MRKLLAVLAVPVLVVALAAGLAFSLGDSPADPASAEDDGWEALHEACERGDIDGMLSAMGGLTVGEEHQAMMEHMAGMHSGDWDHMGDDDLDEMHDDDAGHMADDDLDEMHDDDADHMGDDDLDEMHDDDGMMGGMMGGMHGR